MRHPGEPNSKPFPGYTTSSDSFRASLTPLHPPPSSRDLQGSESSESFHVDSDGKIRPKVRTRFRPNATPVINNANGLARPRKKKTGKIVLKRRKVKKIRHRPKKRPPVSELVKNGREIGSQPEANRGGRPLAPDSNRGRPLAPEANRGRPLAELAFATLSREEQSEEEKNVFGTPRWDIFCIMYFRWIHFFVLFNPQVSQYSWNL